MAARKVKVAVLGTIGKAVLIDPLASRGATLGIDLFTPDGEIGTPNTVRAWLGLAALPPAGVEDDSGSGIVHHRLLQGLTLGDDHPQYTQWIQDEVITGEWTFENTLTFNFGGSANPYDWQAQDDEIHQTIPLRVTNDDGILVENPDYPDAGIELTTFAGSDPLNDGVGNQLAFWEVGTGGAFTPRSYGFRIRHTGDVDAEGNLDFYRHNNDTTGVLFLRFDRASSQLLATDGTASDPIYSFFSTDNSGMYMSADGLAFARNGSRALHFDNGFIQASVPIRNSAGSNATPAYALDADTGMYQGVSSNTISFSTGGTLRLSIGNTDTSGGGETRGIRAALSIRGADGSATVPAFTFTSDDNTGIYSVGADQLGISVGGTLRTTFTTAAVVHTLPISAANGSASAPSYAFTNDLDSGMYRAGTDILGFATAGAVRLQLDAGGGVGFGGANYGSAGQLLQSNGPGASPTWVTATGTGIVVSIIPGDGIIVDDYADPANPEVSVDQTFAFNWTAAHTFSADAPAFYINETDQGANARLWAHRVVAGVYQIGPIRDDRSRFRTGIQFTRDSDSNITAIDIGSASAGSNPAVTFLGSGVFTFSGPLSLSGDQGTSGQLLTSNGTGAPPTWEDPPAGGAGVTVNVYNADDTWSKPAGTAWVEIICIGQGGGGGSGRKGAAGSTRTGGGGGGGGGYSRAVVRASDLAATVAVECNGGGTGGAAVTTDTTNGNNGTAGEPSAFGTVVRAEGGGAGSGGPGNTVSGGSGGRGTECDGGNGGTGGTTTTGSSGADAKYAGGGGGGGHGVSSANNVGGGTNIGGSVILTNPALPGGTATAGAAGGNGQTTGDAPVPGSGGGSGAGNGTGSSNGFNGGNGGAYGGGGGGGGGSTNGGANPSGAGGNGGAGVVIVISYPS